MFGGRKSFLRETQIFELCPIVLNYIQNIFPRGSEKSSCAPYLRACLLGGQLCPSPYTFLARQSHLSRKSFAQRKEMTFDRRLKTLGLHVFSVYIAPPQNLKKKLHEIAVNSQG